MADTPQFSVVIPTYNRAERLKETLLSVLAQRFESFEIVVIDDGSTDHSEAVCESLDDARIRYFLQTNAGPAAARNNGVQQAKGQFIAYLDSDDRWHPDYLRDVKTQLAALDPNSFLYGQIVVDRGVDRYWIKPARAIHSGEEIFDYLYLHGGFMQTSTLVIPHALAEQVSWDESITFGDNDQYAIDLCKTGASPVMQARPLVWYLDIDSGDALSQLFIHDGKSQRYLQFFQWMEGHYDLMSSQARAGFEAHFLSGVHAWSSPLQSGQYLWRAYRQDALSALGLLRQILQNYAPKLYRKLTNTYVARRGLTLSDTPF